MKAINFGKNELAKICNKFASCKIMSEQTRIKFRFLASLSQKLKQQNDGNVKWQKNTMQLLLRQSQLFVHVMLLAKN